MALCQNNGNNTFCANNDDGNAGYSDDNNLLQFALEDYLECNEYQLGENDNEAYYLGPYCAEQGGDVRLGFFMDHECALESKHQANYFESLTGRQIPYTKSSIVSTDCLTCELQEEDQGVQDYYNYDAQGNRNYYTAKEVNEMCGTLYMESGKCETLMDEEDAPYPEEGACTYIEGMKRLSV